MGNILQLAAFFIVEAGIWWLSPPLAIIAGGVTLGLVGLSYVHIGGDN